MKIRPYTEKDRDDVRYICLNSDGPCDSDEEGQHFLLTTYCDYYIEREQENCFVCTDDDDRAVGYILCAQDFDRFWNTFMSDFYPRLDETTMSRQYAIESTVMHKKHKDEYPAHLHIDILPDYQRKGMGRKMTDTLLNHLKNKGVKGLMLCVWKHNKVGQRFYENYGFDRLDENESNIAFCINL